MSVTGSVYVWAVQGSVRALLGSAVLPIGGGGFPAADSTGSLVLSLRNIMAERIEVTTDATQYVSDDGYAGPVDAYGHFSIIAWGDQPTTPAVVVPAFPSTIATVPTAQLLSWYSPTWAASGATPLVAGSELYQVMVTSKSASNAWLLVYDRATAPTDGAQAAAATLIVAIPVPASSLTAIEFSSLGLAVTNGVSWVMSSSPNLQTSLVATDWKTLWQYRHN
jgi:hypothetical protein